jgi:SAM dependent carboxyl methyltransferase
MSDTSTHRVAVMEGKGVYNQHASIPAAGGAAALPLLEEAAHRIELDAGTRPIVIADYGSSEGKNSLAPVRAAISILRARAGWDRAICVCHTDLPGNDFASLFGVLESDPDSYWRDDQNVYACAVGRTFYRQILPREYVDLAWSSYAAVWLSRIPQPIPDHIFISCSTGAVRAAFERQAAEDWKTFLTQRASELRPGGRLVVALPSLDDNGWAPFSDIMNETNAALADMVSAGAISAEEYAGMTVAACLRRCSDLLAPFVHNRTFAGLVVEHCKVMHGADLAWNDYEHDGDAAALAHKRAMFVRAIFTPSLVHQLDQNRSAQQRLAFADRLEEGLRQRIFARPALIPHLVGTIVLAKYRAGESQV